MPAFRFLTVFDDAGNPIGVGVGDQHSMFTEFRDMVEEEDIAIDQAIQILSTNVAKALHIHPKKGILAPQSDADFIVITDDFELQRVWARGQQMVEDGQAIVKGTFEA